MKTLKKILLIVLLMPITCYARGTINVSNATVNMYIGDTTTVNVTTTQAFAQVTSITSGGSASTNVPSSFTIDTGETQSISISAKSVGQTKITLSAVVATYDTEEEYNATKTITINVTERPQAPTTTTPQTTTAAPKNTKVYTTNIPAATAPPVEETTVPVEPTTESSEVKGEEEVVFDVSRFEIIGYDIDFDLDKYEYTIKVDKNVTKLYVIVEGNEIEVIGDKEVDIKDKDQITISLKKGEDVKKYLIRLDKSSEVDKYKKSNKGLKICILVLSIVLVGIGCTLLYFYKFKK